MTTQPETTTTNMARKLALASGAAALAVAGSNNAQAGIVAAQGTPIRPPVAADSRNNWDVDGDGTSEFRLSHLDISTFRTTGSGGSSIGTINIAYLTEMPAQGQGGFGRLLRSPNNRLAKLANGSAVGTAGLFAGNSSTRYSQPVTTTGNIANFAGDWSMGQTGFFGFAFNKEGQRHYGWGDPQTVRSLVRDSRSPAPTTTTLPVPRFASATRAMALPSPSLRRVPLPCSPLVVSSPTAVAASRLSSDFTDRSRDDPRASVEIELHQRVVVVDCHPLVFSGPVENVSFPLRGSRDSVPDP